VASPTAFTELVAEAERALGADDHSRALALADDLLTAYPDALSAWQIRARALSMLRQPLQAAEAYGRILDITPTDVGVMKQCALALSAAGRRDEAAALAHQALDHLLVEPALLSMIAAVGPLPMRGSLREALDYLDAGLIDQGIACLRRLTARAPERLDIRMLLAQALWRQGLRVSAAQTCQTILDELPDCLNAHALLLAFWKRVGPSGFAALHLAAIARIDPDHRHAKLLLGGEAELDESPIQAGEDSEQAAEWVEALAAASTAVPRLPERPTLTPSSYSSATDNLDISISEEMPMNEGKGMPDSLVPLEWQLAEESTTEPLTVSKDLPFSRLSDQADQPAAQRPNRRSRRASGASRAPSRPADEPTARQQQVIARYEQAIAHSQSEQLDQIIAELEVMRAAQPTDRTVYELLGMAYTRKGDLATAMEAYHRAMALAKDKR